jgi:CRISPR-associated protein Csm2
MTRPGGLRPPNQQPGQGQPRDGSQPTAEDLRAIIHQGDAQKLVQVADRIGEHLKQVGLKTSQIRRIFTDVKSIEAAAKARFSQNEGAPEPFSTDLAIRRLVLLKPKLAYQAGRHGRPVRTLKEVLEGAIDRVLDSPDRTEAINNFIHFFEAILAYHKFYGGED